MTKETNKIYWTAKNNSSFLNGNCQANTMRGAVRAARNYVDNELNGEGEILFFDDIDCAVPVRKDIKDIWTNNKWETVFSDK